MHKKNRSLAVLCVISFIVYSVFLLLLYTAFQYFIEKKMQTVFPAMEELLEYRDELESENYMDIPQKNFPGCSYIIFGENGNTVYASDTKIRDSLTWSDLDLISDYGEVAYYSVYKEAVGTGDTGYRILKNSYDSGTGFTRLEGYCVVDHNLNILRGSLFPDKESLTDREFKFLRGFYNTDRLIEKYSYETEDGAERTLVFISPKFSEKTYNALLMSARRRWLYIIPVILMCTLVFTLLFRRKVKQSVDMLNGSIRSYREQGKLEEDRSNVPVEFYDTLDTLKALLEQLEAARLEKQRIIADVSHDLKTPLTVISGYARAFQEGLVPPEDVKRYMGCIRERAELASGLIDTLFEYAKMEHPDYRPVWEETDLCEFTKAFLAEKYTELESAGFALSLSIPERPLEMAMDRKLFRRMLENLINNALRYNPSGTTVFVTIKEKEKKLQLTVADDGTGIRPEVAKAIFTPFVTENTARSSGGGVGLGLSIVRRAVELHHGSVELKVPPDPPYATEFVMKFEKPFREFL